MLEMKLFPGVCQPCTYNMRLAIIYASMLTATQCTEYSKQITSDADVAEGENISKY